MVYAGRYRWGLLRGWDGERAAAPGCEPAGGAQGRADGVRGRKIDLPHPVRAGARPFPEI